MQEIEYQFLHWLWEKNAVDSIKVYTYYVYVVYVTYHT